MSGIGSIIGWFSALSAVNAVEAAKAQPEHLRNGGEAKVFRCWPGNAPAYIFMLWLLQFMLPVVIIARIFGFRELTLNTANAQAILLASKLYGECELVVTANELKIQLGGGRTLVLQLNLLSGIEIARTWLTQQVVFHSPSLPGGKLRLWVASPEQAAYVVQRAAADGKEAAGC